MTTQTANPRRVRVTIEGNARPAYVGTKNLLRVDAGGRVYLVDEEASDTTVETIIPERDWRDGDVVQHSDALWTLTRIRGGWVSTSDNDRVRYGYWTDEKVTGHLIDDPLEEAAPGWGGLVVLRYQAGGEL